MQKLLHKVQPVTGLNLYSSSIKGIYLDALWLTFVGRPSDRSTPNCSVSDCDEAERTETMVGHVCGSRVQRVLTRSDGKVKKDTVTLVEEKGDITHVDEGYAVEHVSAIPKHSYRNEIY